MSLSLPWSRELYDCSIKLHLEPFWTRLSKGETSVNITLCHSRCSASTAQCFTQLLVLKKHNIINWIHYFHMSEHPVGTSTYHWVLAVPTTHQYLSLSATSNFQYLSLVLPVHTTECYPVPRHPCFVLHSSCSYSPGKED